jgi:predicted SnoaL-like aldol condensation-catalyzing enzyme
MRHAMKLAIGLGTCALALACSSEDPTSKPSAASGGAAVANTAGSSSADAGAGANGGTTSSTAGGTASLPKGGNSPAGAAATAGSAGAPGGSTGLGGNTGMAGSAPNAGAGAGMGGATSACDNSLAASNKIQANAALQALFVDKQTSAIAQYWGEPYLQHNPIAKSGVAGFSSVMSGLVSSASFKYERLRSLAECDLVVVQGRYSGTGVIFDMFRMKDGKLVEHWDSDSNQASSADGPTEVSNPEQTAANRAVVLAYLSTAGGEHLAADYVDHRAASAAKLTYTKVHHAIADGNFVFALSEGTLDGKPYGFYDLFRLTGGKLSEHWDSRRAVPATTASGLGIF